jgi:hypothetical protein
MIKDFSHITEDFILEQIEGVCLNLAFLIRDDKIKRKLAKDITTSLDDYLFEVGKEDVMSCGDIYKKVKKELGL